MCSVFSISTKDDDPHTRLRCGRGLYASVDQSLLSGRGHITALNP